MDSRAVDIAVEDLKGSEGFREFVYDDSTYPSVKLVKEDCYLVGGQYKARLTGGTATIGYGDTSSYIIDNYWTRPMSKEQAAALLKIRLTEGYLGPALAMLNNPDSLNPNQQAAIGSFVYNVGIGGWKASTLRSYIDLGKLLPAEISFAFHLWDNPDGALKSRRQKEIIRFLTPWEGRAIDDGSFVPIFVEGG